MRRIPAGLLHDRDMLGVIHTGGPLDDNEVIRAADGCDTALIVCGVRPFRHS